MARNKIWKFVYKVWPNVLRLLEFLRIHSGRQPYTVGCINDLSRLSEIKQFLIDNGFEYVFLAWRDTGEILSMRKVDNELYQYHVRIFDDGEVTGHYEYSSEGNPWKHVMEHVFEPRKDYFSNLLGKYLK